MYQVKVTSLEEFENSRARWNELVLKMKRASIFFTWQWIYTWWEHFGRSYEPLILFVYASGELVAIFPLCIRRESLSGSFLCSRVISYCSSAELAPDHLDIIAQEEHAQGALEAAFDYLMGENVQWDAIFFSHLSEDGRLMNWINKDVQVWTLKRVTGAPFVSLDGNFESYMDRFSKKHRKNMRRLRNQLQEKYGVEYIRSEAASLNEIESCMKELFRLHQSRKGQQRIKTSFKGQNIEQFHLKLAMRIGSMGALRLSSFGIGDHKIAVLYGFAIGSSVMYYNSGFDPEWERYSVGSLLLQEFIEQAFAEGFREFDFLRGEEGYKSVWTDTARPLFNATLYNRTFRAGLANAVAQARTWVTKFRV